MPEIKICGITRAGDAVECARLGADYLGFIFAASPRRVSPREAAEIIRELRGGGARATGVFVNEREQTVREIMELCHLDALQFHGTETPEYCGKFGGTPVIKAFRLRSAGDAEMFRDYRVFAHLADAFVEGKPGGTGKTLPRELAAEAAAASGRLFLSGGLNPGNIAACIAEINPFGVDVSSGVEASPGLKDIGKVKAFIDNARRTDHAS